MRVPAWSEAYAHGRENQQVRLAGSRPLMDQCSQYPPIRRKLLGVTSPAIAPRIEAARDAGRECRNGVKEWSRASSVERLRRSNV